MRVTDWQRQLSEFGAAHRNMPFAWGVNDCCLFAADAVFAITGEDLAGDYRGSYDDAKSALRVMPVGGLRGVASRALGDPVSPLMAAVGDVVLMTNEGRELLAICNGVSTLAPGPNGMMALSMEAAIAAWKI